VIEMTGEAHSSLLGAWRLAGALALAGLAFVYRETVRLLDERACRSRVRIDDDGRGRG
jgi:hypothetical protein